MSNPELECRFYRNEHPENDELVRVRIVQKEPGFRGFSCHLLEYDNIEGMVLLNELRRGRIRSYNKILRKNKEYTCLVLRVHKSETDSSLVSADLSLKAVPADQLAFAQDKWEKSKTVHAIMRHVAHKANCNTIDLYEKFGWPMADKFGHIYIGFKAIMNADKLTKMSPEEREAEIKRDLEKAGAPEGTVDFFCKGLLKRMQPTPQSVLALVEMKCLGVSGVGGIRKTLQVAIDMTTEEFPIVVRVIAAPEFSVSCSTMDAQAGKQRVTDILAKMKETLESEEGSFKIIEEPKVEAEVVALTKSDWFKFKSAKKQAEEDEAEEAKNREVVSATNEGEDDV